MAAQAATGFIAYRQSLADAGLPMIGFGAFLGTGSARSWIDGVFSNWQAALLQLAVLITFASVLRQKGAAHSLAYEGTPLGGNPTSPAQSAPKASRAGWVYAHSLSLAFFALFALMFVLHAVFGLLSHNEQQALRHLPGSTLGAYVASAEFWATVFSTWEAEFAAIAIFVVATIFLRQDGSAESKPVDAPNDETGETNH